MASSNAQSLLAEVEEALAALESACADGERALAQGDADLVQTSIADQRRLTHALQNAMDASRAVRTNEFDERILNRIRYIGLIRDRHIQMIRQRGENIQEQLNTLTRWKRAARKWLSGYSEKRTSGLDHTR